jgi:hypothetical protein
MQHSCRACAGVDLTTTLQLSITPLSENLGLKLHTDAGAPASPQDPDDVLDEMPKWWGKLQLKPQLGSSFGGASSPSQAGGGGGAGRSGCTQVCPEQYSRIIWTLTCSYRRYKNVILLVPVTLVLPNVLVVSRQSPR